MNEREEQLADRFRADHEAEMDCEVVKINGLRFQYDRGELEDIEWEDADDFLAWHGEKLFEDAYAESSREAQKILSYAWLRVRQAEAKEQDAKVAKLKAQAESLRQQVQEEHVPRALPQSAHYNDLVVREREVRAEIDKMKLPQLRAIECIHLDDDAMKYLEELCDPKGCC